MIRTVLTLQLSPGGAEGLIETFRRRRILETSLAQPGCLGAELDVSSDEREAIVTATWEDEHAYSVWTSRHDRGDLSSEISRYLAVPLTAKTTGRIYTVTHRPAS